MVGGDVELALGTVFGLMVRPLADDTNVQFTTGLAAAVAVTRPIIAGLVTGGLLGGRRTMVVYPAVSPRMEEGLEG